MSNSQTYDPVTVSSDGVSVAKRFEADEFPVPAIAFRIESNRTESVTVTLVDTVPEDVSVEDLGFHPEYGSEHWTIDGKRITFEREFEPDSEYTTVYGIRSTGTDDVEKFLTEPTIETVDPPLDDDGDVLDESSSDVVKDVIAGESDSVPGLDEDEDEEIETLDLKDPNDPSAGTVGDDGQGGDGEGGGSAQSNVTTTLLAEIHHDAVDEDVIRALRQELALDGASGGDSGATDARIQHLQNEVSDLAAYTEALEEFLADNGTGDQMIRDFRDRLDSFEDELDRIQRMTVENDEAMDEVRSEVDQVSEQMSGVEETVSSVEGAVDEVEGTVETLDSDVDSIGDEVDTLGEDVSGMEDSLSTLEAEVDSLRSDIEDVDDRVGDIGDVDDRIGEIESEIEDLKQWREQLSSVIGGGE